MHALPAHTGDHEPELCEERDTSSHADPSIPSTRSWARGAYFGTLMALGGILTGAVLHSEKIGGWIYRTADSLHSTADHGLAKPEAVFRKLTQAGLQVRLEEVENADAAVIMIAVDDVHAMTPADVATIQRVHALLPDTKIYLSLPDDEAIEYSLVIAHIHNCLQDEKNFNEHLADLLLQTGPESDKNRQSMLSNLHTNKHHFYEAIERVEPEFGPHFTKMAKKILLLVPGESPLLQSLVYTGMTQDPALSQHSIVIGDKLKFVQDALNIYAEERSRRCRFALGEIIPIDTEMHR